MSFNIDKNSSNMINNYNYEEVKGQKLLDIKDKNTNKSVGQVAMHKTFLHRGSVKVTTNTGKNFYVKQADFDVAINDKGATLKRISQPTVSQNNDNVDNSGDLKQLIRQRIAVNPLNICNVRYLDEVKNDHQLFIDAVLLQFGKEKKFTDEEKGGYNQYLNDFFKKNTQIINSFCEGRGSFQLQKHFREAVELLHNKDRE